MLTYQLALTERDNIFILNTRTQDAYVPANIS